MLRIGKQKGRVIAERETETEKEGKKRDGIWDTPGMKQKVEKEGIRTRARAKLQSIWKEGERKKGKKIERRRPDFQINQR